MPASSTTRPVSLGNAGSAWAGTTRQNSASARNGAHRFARRGKAEITRAPMRTKRANESPEPTLQAWSADGKGAGDGNNIRGNARYAHFTACVRHGNSGYVSGVKLPAAVPVRRGRAECFRIS